MKTTKRNKGVCLFFYLITGLGISAVLSAGLQYAFPGPAESLNRMWVVFILCIALVSFFLSKIDKTSMKAVGYILSIVEFSILILFLYQLFAVEHLFSINMFFFGSAIAGECIMFVITVVGPPKKFYAGIGGAVCVVVSGMILWGYTGGSLKTVFCVVLCLIYLYFSSLYYLEYSDPGNSELLEKGGMTFNIVALFISLYGRYTYSWRR